VHETLIKSVQNDKVLTWDLRDSRIKACMSTGLKEENWNIVSNIVENNNDNSVYICSSKR